MGYDVSASKVTGTASLKDILHMQDAGASIVNDFTHFGYPSTYLLEEKEVVKIFNDLDLKYANNIINLDLYSQLVPMRMYYYSNNPWVPTKGTLRSTLTTNIFVLARCEDGDSQWAD
jgi:hypothetical protein